MDGKVILIAGGSGGIGTACAKLFSRAGAKIVLAARNTSVANETAKEINNSGGEAFVIQFDATDPVSVSGMAESVVEELGRIDVLINAFGEGMIKPILDVNPDDARRVFAKRSNIKFTLLYLGRVDTAFYESESIDMRIQKDKMLTATEVAKAVYYAVSQPGQSVLNEITIQPESHLMI